ncbi:MAG TPA: poly-gamma-glutamate system protein [bacterium]|jgi:poly-gamma-glutamate system protein
MQFRPSLRSVWTLVTLAVVCYGLYLWCENSHVKRKTPFYEEKIAAANLMDRALRAYQGATSEKGVFGENYKDPRLDAVIGQQFSLITTDIGAFETEVVGANPNFAAVVVDLLGKAGVERGDYVAVGFTGSHPGVNTAVLCACEALGATPVTISAVGSSWWGANDPDFTWVDMETLLNREGIVHSLPIAGSFGGINDIGVGLSQVGQELMKEAIQRNNLALIHEESVSASVQKRYQRYTDAAKGRKFKAYVDVGSGIASLGHDENAKLIRNGFNHRLPLQNYPARGVVHLFNADGVPVINIADILALSRDYGLGGAHVPLPAIGNGLVFMDDRYDLRVAGISAFLAILVIVVLVKLDSRLFKLADNGVDPDTLSTEVIHH